MASRSTGELGCRAEITKISHLRVQIGHRGFYPWDKLQQFLTKEKVEELLGCRCSKCKRDNDGFSNNVDSLPIVPSIIGVPGEPSTRKRSAFSLFGILVFLERPLLVIGFLALGWSDYWLEEYPGELSREKLKNCVGSFHVTDSVEFEHFASRFQHFLPEFTVQRFYSGTFEAFAENTVLPFTGERKISKRRDEREKEVRHGAYSEVYAFTAYGGYVNFPVSRQPPSFHFPSFD
jgi:hypothetical protein